jgi:hypothetical protein
MTDDIEITGVVNAKWVKVDQPEPGFLVQLEGEKMTMTTYMTDDAVVQLIGWLAHELKDKIDEALAALGESKVTH